MKQGGLLCRRVATVLAAVGAGLQALLLLGGLLVPGDLHVGTVTLNGVAAAVWLAVFAVALTSIAVLLRRRSMLGVGLAIVLAVIGTTIGVWGAAVGGSTGSLPLLYWPLLGGLAIGAGLLDRGAPRLTA